MDALLTANPVTIKKFVQTELEIKVEMALQVGRGNAIKMRQLKEKIGYNNDRRLRLVIEGMRLKGHLILSDAQVGYWYAKDFNEYKAWADFMYSYIGDLSHTVKVVGESAVAKFNQVYQSQLFWS